MGFAPPATVSGEKTPNIAIRRASSIAGSMSPERAGDGRRCLQKTTRAGKRMYSAIRIQRVRAEPRPINRVKTGRQGVAPNAGFLVRPTGWLESVSLHLSQVVTEPIDRYIHVPWHHASSPTANWSNG